MKSNPPPTTTTTPSASSRGRYNATAVMLVDVPNMDDDDVLMTSSCSSSRGSGSLEGGGGQEKKTKKKKNKKNSDDKIKYIEYKDIDNAVIGIEHDADEIRTFASSTSSSSASRRNRNLRNCRSGEGDGETRSTRLQQINQQHKQQQQSRRCCDDDESDNNHFGTRRQLQNGQLPRSQQMVAEDEDDEEDDRPIPRMRKGDIIPESVGTSTNSGNGISRNSAIFEILSGQSGMFHENEVINTVNKFEDHEEEEEENDEYYSNASIRTSGMKNDQLDKKIHHRCQKLFGCRCCSIRLPLTSYLNDEHGIIKPIKALSCIFVCFVVMTSIAVIIALTVSHHMHPKDVPTLESSGGVGGGGVSGVSNTLSAAEMASMSNADRLILAERIDHVCDKLHSTNVVDNEWSSDGSSGGECWSLCHEKRCCFTEDGTRRRRRLSDPMSRQRLRRRGHDDEVYEQTEHHKFRRLQLAHSTIPGENDFTYIAHKVNGSNTKTTEEVSSEEEKEENCGDDPNEFCLLFAGCAPLFGK